MKPTGQGASGFIEKTSEDLQGQLRSIKETLVRQHLPEDLIFLGKCEGINKQSWDVAAVLQKCATYVETGLKLTGSRTVTIQEHLDPSEEGHRKVFNICSDLGVTFGACLHYL